MNSDLPSISLQDGSLSATTTFQLKQEPTIGLGEHVENAHQFFVFPAQERCAIAEYAESILLLVGHAAAPESRPFR